MKNLVRGGVILSILGLFAVIFYGQTRTETAPKANDSQQQLNNNIEEINTDTNTSDDKKLVKKTASERKVVAAGASRGPFTATAYCLRGRTAMGHSVRAGLIAADPRVLRLGSRINLSAGAYSGNYLVSDTGGGIKGRRLDIWMASCAEARRFGRRNVTVAFLGQ